MNRRNEWERKDNEIKAKERMQREIRERIEFEEEVRDEIVKRKRHLD